MSSPNTMPPLIDTNTSEPSSVVLTPNASVDAKDAAATGIKGHGRAPSRLDLDLQASVRKLEEAQRRRDEARQGADSRRGSGDSDGQSTPGDGGKMAPPPLPVTIHAPTPMSRMPSLSQITSHLHIPSPSTPSSTSQNMSPARATPISSIPLPEGSSPGTASAGHGFAMSPSGRLRLPASAMTRSRSGSGSGSSVATLKSLGMFRSGSAQSTSSVLGNAAGGLPGGSKVASSAGSDAESPVSASPQPSPTMVVAGTKSVDVFDGAGKKAETGTWRSRTAGAPTSGIKQSSGAGGSVPAPSGSLEHAKGAVEGIVTSEKPAKIDMSKPLKLKHTWTMYYDAKGYKPDLAQSAAKDGGTGLGQYEQSLLHVGTIDTVQSFAQHMTSLRAPSRLPKNANYHLFKSPIRPMWEDPSNAKGGKWVVLFRSCPHLLDWAWMNLTMGLIGEVLDEEDQVTGVVGSCRPKMDRIQVWTRGRGLDEKGVNGDGHHGHGLKEMNELGKRIWEMMRLEGEVENVSIEFQYNDSNSHPPAGRFFTVPFSGRSFSSSYSAASSTKSVSSSTLPTLNLPSNPLLSPSGVSSANSSRSPSRAPSGSYRSTSASGSTIGLSMSPKAATPYLPSTTSPLQQSTRFDNTPTGSPALGSSPSFGGAGAGLMGMNSVKHSLPRPPDIKTVKASYGPADSATAIAAMPTPLASSKILAAGLASLPPTPSPAVQAAGHHVGTAAGGSGMKRAGSNQGSQAFAGPMGGGLGLGLRGGGR